MINKSSNIHRYNPFTKILWNNPVEATHYK